MKLNKGRKAKDRYYYDQGEKVWNVEALRWLKDGCTQAEARSHANRLVGKNRQDLIKVGKTQSMENEK